MGFSDMGLVDNAPAEMACAGNCKHIVNANWKGHAHLKREEVILANCNLSDFWVDPAVYSTNYTRLPLTYVKGLLLGRVVELVDTQD